MRISSNRAASIVVFVLFFVFFLLTLANNFSAPHDAIDYLNEIETGKDLFNPHHVLYHIIAYWLFNILKPVFAHTPPHYLIEAMDAVWGTLILVTFFNFLQYRFKYDRLTAFIATCLPAFSFGMWFYSTNIEVYMPPLFFLLLALYILTDEPLTKKKLYLAITFHVLAILFHQVNILFTPIILFKIWQHRKDFSPGPVLLRYALLGGGIVLLTYAVIGRFVLGHKTIDEIVYWMKGYTNQSTYWFPVSLSTLFNAVVGLTHAFIGAHFLFRVPFIEDAINKKFYYHNLTDELFLVQDVSHQTAWILLILSGVLFLIVLFLLVTIIRKWKVVKAQYGTVITPLLLFLVIYSIFFYFWMPENLEFWIAQSVVFWLVLAGSCRAFDLPFNSSRRTIFGAMAILLLAINYYGSIKWLRNFKYDLFYAKVVPVKDIATKKDVILLEDPWIIESYLQRYTKAGIVLIPQQDSVQQRSKVDSILTSAFNHNGRVFLYTDKTVMHAVKNEPYVDSLLQAGHIVDTIHYNAGKILVLSPSGPLSR